MDFNWWFCMKVTDTFFFFWQHRHLQVDSSCPIRFAYCTVPKNSQLIPIEEWSDLCGFDSVRHIYLQSDRYASHNIWHRTHSSNLVAQCRVYRSAQTIRHTGTVTMNRLHCKHNNLSKLLAFYEFLKFAKQKTEPRWTKKKREEINEKKKL